MVAHVERRANDGVDGCLDLDKVPWPGRRPYLGREVTLVHEQGGESAIYILVGDVGCFLTDPVLNVRVQRMATGVTTDGALPVLQRESWQKTAPHMRQKRVDLVW
jgi:hypothetical protein